VGASKLVALDYGSISWNPGKKSISLASGISYIFLSVTLNKSRDGMSCLRDGLGHLFSGSIGLRKNENTCSRLGKHLLLEGRITQAFIASENNPTSLCDHRQPSDIGGSTREMIPLQMHQGTLFLQRSNDLRARHIFVEEKFQ
jgi:hypothetical protein